MKDLYWYQTVILHIASIYTGDFETVIDPSVLQLPPTKNLIRIRRQNCPVGLQFFWIIWSIINFDKLGHYFHRSFCLSWRTVQHLIKKIPLLLTWIFQGTVPLPQTPAITSVPVHSFLFFRLLFHEATLSGNWKIAFFIYISLDVFVVLWLCLSSFPWDSSKMLAV